VNAASVGRIEVRALVPRTLDVPATERLRSAVGKPLVDAVPEAFDLLERIDPGSYWVLRAVQVEVRVPASEPDVARSAERIARAMAVAIERVVHEGPSAEAVRFASRAAYVASYVGVVLDGSNGGWIFGRLGPLVGLPAADVLLAAARAVQADLLAVVEALVAAGRWARLLDASRAAEAGRLEAALSRLEAPSLSGGAVAAVQAVRRPGTAAALPAPRPSSVVERRLRLLGEVLASGLPGPEAVAAVWAVERDDPAGAPGRGGPRPADSAVPSTLAEGPVPGPADHELRILEAAVPSPPLDERLSALGSAALLLVPDLDDLVPRAGPGEILAGTSRAAGDARALVLAAVLGRDVGEDDAAIRLAAGAEPLRRHDPDHVDEDLRGLADGLASWKAELRDDEVLGWVHPGDAEWFAPLASRHEELVPVARALMRQFAAHFAGFGRAGASYLAERVLPLGGTVRLDEDAVVVELPRAPLHVLLALAGLDAFSCRCRWLDVPVVVVHEAD
jgi:hypothetical protein